MKALVSLLFTLTFCLSINAFTLDDKLRDKTMEEQATDLFKIIKCPICSGELLSESESKIAQDMRKAIRKKISDGYANKQIISELKNSYGDSIVIIPPIKFSTYVLWFIPLIILIIGCLLVRKIHQVEEAPLLSSSLPVVSPYSAFKLKKKDLRCFKYCKEKSIKRNK